MQAISPQGIIVDVVQRLMQVTWTDGHVSLYEFAYLRGMCPCAQCRPSPAEEAQGKIPASVLTAQAELKSPEDVTPVGTYAINIRWADGHTYGIYNWEYLRWLCPCPEHSPRS